VYRERHELLEIDRLLDVGVGSQAAGFGDVAILPEVASTATGTTLLAECAEDGKQRVPQRYRRAHKADFSGCPGPDRYPGTALAGRSRSCNGRCGTAS